MPTIVLEGSVTKEKISEIQYYFDITTEEMLEAGSDITDQYVEDNSAIQDHVAIKPVEIILTGFVGEKVFKPQELKTSEARDLVGKFNPIASFVPPLSSYVETAIGAASYIESSIVRYRDNIKNIKDVFSKDKTDNSTRQSKVFFDLKGLRDARKLVTVYIENIGKFENYLIKNVRMSQEDSIYQSRLIVELKEFNSVNTQTTALDLEKYKERISIQRANEENLGKVQGIAKDRESTLYRWTYGGGK